MGPLDWWFHAASAGELESLAPLIQEAALRGEVFAVSIFSRSAEAPLLRLQAELRSGTNSAFVMKCGYSPAEGRWGPALSRARPKRWVTAKYEAWPDVWISCVKLGVPIAVVGAKPRAALSISAAASRLLAGKVPQVYLIPFLSEDLDALRVAFPWAKRIELGSDPRWDRVFVRAQRSHSRAEFIWALVRSRSSGPFGVLAQVWPEDLEIWRGALAQVPGTFVVFPHSIEPEVLQVLENSLRAEGVRVFRTAGLQDLPEEAPHGEAEIWLVNEIGFLAEFYAKADWVFVGGGFGAGVHSTLEPAAFGLPIAAGPARADKFPEISLLLSRGQLTLVAGTTELRAWLGTRPWEGGISRRAEWKAALPRPGESTQRLRAVLETLP